MLRNQNFVKLSPSEWILYFQFTIDWAPPQSLCGHVAALGGLLKSMSWVKGQINPFKELIGASLVFTWTSMNSK